jgi:putative ATP-binding cassette transporter
MAIISGIANSLVLAIINMAAQMVASNIDIEAYFMVFYIFTFMLFIYTKKYSLSQATIAIEDALAKVRLRITDKIRRSELEFIEKKGKVEIYTDLTQDTNLISEAAADTVNAAQSGLVLIFCLFYVAWLSLPGFILTIVFLGFGILIYLFRSQSFSSVVNAMRKKETNFFDGLNQILEGFKEIKINQQKSDDLFFHLKTISDETLWLKIRVNIQYIMTFMFSYTVPNLLLGIVVFILPMFSSMSAEVVVKIVATTLFVIAPVEAIVSALPLFVRANITVKHLHQLELELDASSKQIASVEQTEDKRFFDFKNIQLEEIIFQYRDKQDNQLFHVGPINLTIQQGEILFIVGGNGSGKSTLLKLLTGLYYPSTGVIVVDSEMIDKYNYQAYRELFSIIFTDFHLFDRVYGLPTVDEQQLQALLQLMELEQKTKYFDGQFTHLNLSTGQKKRLAFIVAVLENKPIYIFDELAADQDPHFRKFFYREVLLDLRNQGKTIIAVTHDDKYFEVADRVLKMDYGQIVDWDWK